MSKIDPNSILSVYRTLRTSATNVNTINTLKRNSLIMNGFVTVDKDEKEQNELMQSLEVGTDDEEHDEEEEPTYHHHYYQPRPEPSGHQRPPGDHSAHKNSFSRETFEKIDRPTPTLSTASTAVSSTSTAATMTTVQSSLQPSQSNMKGKGGAVRDKRFSIAAPKRSSLTATGSEQGRKLFLTKKYLVQMELVERFIWDYKQDYNLLVDEHLKTSTNMHISEQLHRLLM